jgi:hypothetical protein
VMETDLASASPLGDLFQVFIIYKSENKLNLFESCLKSTGPSDPWSAMQLTLKLSWPCKSHITFH